MTDKELIKGLFHPDSQEESDCCWAAIFPFVSDDKPMTPQEHKLVVDVYGKTLLGLLSSKALGSEIDYYRYYQAELWIHIKKYAQTWQTEICDMVGLYAWLKKYTRYFACDELKKKSNETSMEEMPRRVSMYRDDDSDWDNDDDGESSDELLGVIMEQIEVSDAYPEAVLEHFFKMMEKDESMATMIEDLRAIYIRGLSLEERAKEKGLGNVKSMGPIIRRARTELMMVALPQIRERYQQVFRTLKEKYPDLLLQYLQEDDIKWLILFFELKMDIKALSKRVGKSPSALKIPLYTAIRNFYKAVEDYHDMRQMKVGKNSFLSIYDIF